MAMWIIVINANAIYIYFFFLLLRTCAKICRKTTRCIDSYKNAAKVNSKHDRDKRQPHTTRNSNRLKMKQTTYSLPLLDIMK